MVGQLFKGIKMATIVKIPATHDCSELNVTNLFDLSKICLTACGQQELLKTNHFGTIVQILFGKECVRPTLTVTYESLESFEIHYSKALYKEKFFDKVTITLSLNGKEQIAGTLWLLTCYM